VAEGSETRLPWDGVREVFRDVVRAEFAPWGSSKKAYLEQTLAFALGRFDEGIGFVGYFDLASQYGAGDVLDLGTGTGGVALAFANCPRYRVSAIDVGQNRILRKVTQATGLPLRYALANGLELPYREEAFDTVLLIEAIEHISRPALLGREIFRVLRPGGVCLVSTPARLRYVLGRDPHYGVPFVAGLPNAVQRFVVNRIARRRIVSPDGRSWPAYDVERLYWHVNEIARIFPGSPTVEPLFARAPAGGLFLSGEWWRSRFRKFLFNHVVIRKP
jgi:SAM-dependent methyltransferase